MIQDIRNRTGARVSLFEEEKGCAERILQVGRPTRALRIMGWSACVMAVCLHIHVNCGVSECVCWVGKQEKACAQPIM
jgi:hypothetical protein